MRLYSRHMLAAIGAVAIVAIGAPAAADVKAGVDAWARGDYDAAVREWRPLAERGDADAQFNMGQAYKLGRGVPSDLQLATAWYEKAAAQGHKQAQGNLGLILFQNGDRAGAMPWIKKAADAGDARAQYVLGTAYYNGELVERDLARAYAMTLRASAQGLPQATSNLAEMDQTIPETDRARGREIASELARLAAAQSAPDASSQSAAASVLPVPATPKAPRVSGRPAPEPSAAKAPASRPSPAPTRVVVTPGRWKVQLGAFSNEGNARRAWAQASKVGALSGLQPSYVRAGAVTRLQAGPLASRSAADRVCTAAKSAGQACLPVAP